MKAILLFLGGIGAAEILALLLSIAIFILIFLVLRAFFHWYWRINTIIENQEKQIVLLSKLVQERGPVASDDDPAGVAEKARKYDEMTKRTNG